MGSDFKYKNMGFNEKCLYFMFLVEVIHAGVAAGHHMVHNEDKQQCNNCGLYQETVAGLWVYKPPL